jgi:hypothetical protein
MMLEILKVIVLVSAVTTVMAWAVYWWVQASLSDDLRSRRHARAAEILLSLGMCMFWTVQLAHAYGRKFAILGIAVVVAVWLSPGARLLLQKRKHAQSGSSPT